MKHALKFRCGLLAASIAALSSPQATAASFTGLGDLAGGAFQSYALGVSGDGSTVVGYSSVNDTGGSEAFRWTRAGGLQSLGAMPSIDHNAYGSAASANGSVIAGYGRSERGTESFRWTAATGLVPLGGLGANDGFTRVDDMSADGSVLVGYSQTSAHPNGAGYYWTPASGMTSVGLLPGDVWSWARGVSNDGSVIVGQSNSFSGGQAFRWTQATGTVGLGLAPGAATTSATDIANDGTIAGGGRVGGLSQSMVWTQAGGWESLGSLAGYQQSGEAGISVDGSLVFGQVFNYDSVTSTFTNEGMVWDRAHGMRFAKDWLTQDYGIDLAGWTLQYVSGVSDDNKVVVGYGINPNGNTEAWMANLNSAPVPLPAGGYLMVTGLLALAGLRRPRLALRMC